MGQKSRATKTSKGMHGGGGKTNLTPLQLILLGKGPYAKVKPPNCTPYRGAMGQD